MKSEIDFVGIDTRIKGPSVPEIVVSDGTVSLYEAWTTIWEAALIDL